MLGVEPTIQNNGTRWFEIIEPQLIIQLRFSKGGLGAVVPKHALGRHNRPLSTLIDDSTHAGKEYSFTKLIIAQFFRVAIKREF